MFFSEFALSNAAEKMGDIRNFYFYTGIMRCLIY